MNVNPLHDYVLLKVTHERKNQLQSGILIPEKVDKQPMVGIVEKLGPSGKIKKRGIIKKMKVIYDKFNSKRVYEEKDVRLVLIRAEHILAKIVEV